MRIETRFLILMPLLLLVSLASNASAGAVLDMSISTNSDFVTLILYNGGRTPAAIGPMIHGQSTSDLMVEIENGKSAPSALPSKEALRRWAASRYLYPGEFVGVRIPVAELLKGSKMRCRKISFAYSYFSRGQSTNSRAPVVRYICK